MTDVQQTLFDHEVRLRRLERLVLELLRRLEQLEQRVRQLQEQAQTNTHYWPR